MKKESLIFIGVLLFVSFSTIINVNAETGCCLNAYVSACSSQQMELSDCCPTDGIYGNQGPSSQEDCTQSYFVSGESCANVNDCTPGCCCDPDPNPKPHVECLGPEGTVFWGDFNGQRCNSDFCDQFDFIELPPTHYDCSNGEPNVEASAITGEKVVKLTITAPPDCSTPVDHYIIERKTGSSGFHKLNDNFNGLIYVDHGVNWETVYTYKITAVYDSTHSFSTAIQFTTGDFVCWGIMDQTSFCIGPHYFDSSVFKSYFSDLQTSYTNYSDWVNFNYASYFGNGWSCDSDNFANLELNCDSGTICMKVGEASPLKCYSNSNCSLGSVQNPFGLFGDVSQCEGIGDNKKYCFFDYSKSIANKCYKCNPAMECYDYKSKETCERDNCKANGLSGCEWVTYNPELNIGVCKSKGKDNCWAVIQEGTGKVKSLEAHNMIFNGPSQEKLNALAYPSFPCGTLNQYTCDELTCENLSSSDCGSNSVILNNNNDIIQGSDLCGGTIKVCSMLNGKCVKDANGDQHADCDSNDLTCQKDHYPPITTLEAGGILTPEDTIQFEITDKTEAQETYQTKALSEGYKLYICAYSELGSECGLNGYNDLSDYSEVTDLSMTVRNMLQNPNLNMSIDQLNTLKFFAVDPNGNVETMKSEEIRIIPFYQNGMGIFVEEPKPGWIHSKEITLKYYVASEADKIYFIKIFNKFTNIPLAEVLDDTSLAAYNFEKNTPLHLNEGPNVIEIKIKTLGGKEKASNYTYTVDTNAPLKPILYPISNDELGNTNHVTIKGNLPGFNAHEEPVIQIYDKLGDGLWTKVSEASIDSQGNFSYELELAQEGDYQVKVRAIDKAQNTGAFSDNVSFSFVKSAPTFSVNPPDGAVRPYVDNIKVVFHLVSNNVGMDKVSTYVRLSKEGTQILGDKLWEGNSNVTYTPRQTLTSGSYTVEVNSVDNSSSHHTLKMQSHFTIDEVPLITTDLESDEFKTRDNPIIINGDIDGLGEMIIDAFINVTNIPGGIYAIPAGDVNVPINGIPVALNEGNNLVKIIATNQLGKVAVEPYTIVLDTTPPNNPTFIMGG